MRSISRVLINVVLVAIFLMSVFGCASLAPLEKGFFISKIAFCIGPPTARGEYDPVEKNEFYQNMVVGVYIEFKNITVVNETFALYGEAALINGDGAIVAEGPFLKYSGPARPVDQQFCSFPINLKSIKGGKYQLKVMVLDQHSGIADTKVLEFTIKGRYDV